ncbi:MAG: hypothetical protein AAGB16_08635 [Pseudomonadota bacterium]
MQEYTFKATPMRRPQSWMVQDGQLLRRGAAKALKLSDVTKAAWGDLTHRGMRNAWLHLTGPDEVVKIECNDSGLGDEREIFLKLCQRVCEGLEQENPDLPIRQGGSDALRWSLFLIGLMATLGGLFFVWSVVSGSVRQNELTVLLIGGFMILAFGALAWAFAPWQPVQTLKPREMSLLLSGMSAPMQRPDDDA